tara:strand:+ start:5841 stop:6038 length:198 start_codon:yes stop_codon:yes gene_type:complete
MFNLSIFKKFKNKIVTNKICTTKDFKGRKKFIKTNKFDTKTIPTIGYKIKDLVFKISGGILNIFL